MSGRVVGWAAEQVTGSPVSKLVLLKLADNANDDGVCWPSLALLVEHTELTKNTVIAHLNRLEEAGFLRIERRTSGTVNLSNVYHLCVPAPARRGKAVVQDVNYGGSAAAALPVQPTAGGSAASEPRVVHLTSAYIEEPSFEPSKNLHHSPDGAVDTPPSASLEERQAQALASWPPVWTAFIDLPGLANAPITEGEARDAWVRVCLDEKHPPEEIPAGDEMVECIRGYGRWLTSTNSTRPKDRPQMPQFPQNWMRERKFVPYLAKVRAAASRDRGAGDAVKETLAALGEEVVTLLRRARINDVEIGSWFGAGGSVELGEAEVVVSVRKSFQQNWIRERFAERIGNIAGKPVRVVLAEASP